MEAVMKFLLLRFSFIFWLFLKHELPVIGAGRVLSRISHVSLLMLLSWAWSGTINNRDLTVSTLALINSGCAQIMLLWFNRQRKENRGASQILALLLSILTLFDWYGICDNYTCSVDGRFSQKRVKRSSSAVSIMCYFNIFKSDYLFNSWCLTCRTEPQTLLLQHHI